ncbi:MAG: shikimate kinase AroK [Steroidobacter sp.]
MTTNSTTNIFLIGPMGSGKTAVGKHLARMLDMQLYDSDAEIERITGVDIPYIFEKEGESKFRERETEVIDNLTQLNGIVLATGGGAILSSANREYLAQRGRVVYLQTSVEQQLERTRQTRHRPLLHTADPEQRLRDLLILRAPLYESIANLVVSTDHRRVHGVAMEIIHGLGLTVNSKLELPKGDEHADHEHHS